MASTQTMSPVRKIRHPSTKSTSPSISVVSTIPQPKPSRTQCLFIAELAGEAERYEDVIEQIKLIATHYDNRLMVEERNLISIAYKNLTNTLRNSWRIVDTLEQVQATHKLKGKGGDQVNEKVKQKNKRHVELIRGQRRKIEQELAKVCQDIVTLLDGQLIPASAIGEERVFYSKMKGDYFRYLAEFARPEDQERYAEESLLAYKAAYSHAINTLDPVHPTRLGLALNFSVYFHDVRKSPERACHLAKNALDSAVEVLSGTGDLKKGATPEQGVRDALMILQLLRDDLLLWSNELLE